MTGEPGSGVARSAASAVWYREPDGWRIADPAGDPDPWTWRQVCAEFGPMTSLVSERMTVEPDAEYVAGDGGRTVWCSSRDDSLWRTPGATPLE